jgi:predicted amidophosphoribosyltransferase
VTAWRETCRECGKPTVPNRAWCSECLKAIKYWGVVDKADALSYRDARRVGVPDGYSKVPR